MDDMNSSIVNVQEKYGLKNIPYVEHIWGHRFRPEQTPMLLLFELLCVIENQYQAKKKGFINNIFSPENNTLYFRHKRSFKLRILLYQNEILETIHRSNASDSEKWERQADFLKKLDGDNFCFDDDDIEHIRMNFKSFDSYYNSLKILSSLTFDSLSNKRWTSKFIFPISHEYIWCDFNNVDGSEDRRFFARGGEIVYLMLCRSSENCRNQLEELFSGWLESDEDSYSNLARALAIPEERYPLEGSKRRNLGYLPHTSMQCFETLAEDIIKTLELDLERLDKIKLFSDIIGFHIGNYIYSVGEQGLLSQFDIENKSPTYMAEVLTKTTNSIRKASIQSVSTQKNRLKRVLSNNIPKIFDYYDEFEDKTERSNILRESEQEAAEYLNKNIVGYPHVCFRHIGFVSRKNTRSFRYVITEDFLHSLVITILGTEKRLEFRKFMKALTQRYNIFIDQAPNQDSEILQSDLNRNAKNLSVLLYQMGMLRHLSDACSYVVNPYKEDTL
ncbi:hypothetical protein J4N42_05350 [Vibrio sp. SCSIO 43135]|uniref:hypothetical protein n=1 Tax=Vibrio sp. SCSIO 43135 TaxID=2819096 RepID=UPI002075BD03|nr:hypothetical protein [Vibrio sp. SCSIO 43135]USD42148.1 hypothetical protein J4N42_05350 [Vibrio sp. SCSIO 43135]